MFSWGWNFVLTCQKSFLKSKFIKKQQAVLLRSPLLLLEYRTPQSKEQKRGGALGKRQPTTKETRIL